MEYNTVLPSSSEVSTEKVEKYSREFFELNQYERKAVIQNIIGKDFELVGSLRILPKGQVRKNLGTEARRDDID